MTRVEEFNYTKIRFWFIIKKLSNIFQILFGALIVIGLFVLFLVQNPPSRLSLFDANLARFPDRGEIMRIYHLITTILFSMVISGVLGVIISLPITISLSRKLKSLQSMYINQESRQNNDFIKPHQRSIKPVKPPKFY